jgi:hypothetical protein
MKTFKEYITEGLFSKDKDENFDFGESMLINITKRFGLKPKGKIIDKSGTWGFNLNIIQELKENITYEQSIEIKNFLKKYKYKQNTASEPELVSGTFYADGDKFYIMTDDIDEKAKPYLRIYTLGENK